MSLLKKSLITVLAIYLLYVLKWAAGINLFTNFSAPKFVKRPAEITVLGVRQLGLNIALPGQETPYS